MHPGRSLTALHTRSESRAIQTSTSTSSPSLGVLTTRKSTVKRMRAGKPMLDSGLGGPSGCPEYVQEHSKQRNSTLGARPELINAAMLCCLLILSPLGVCYSCSRWLVTVGLPQCLLWPVSLSHHECSVNADRRCTTTGWQWGPSCEPYHRGSIESSLHGQSLGQVRT